MAPGQHASEPVSLRPAPPRARRLGRRGARGRRRRGRPLQHPHPLDEVICILVVLGLRAGDVQVRRRERELDVRRPHQLAAHVRGGTHAEAGGHAGRAGPAGNRGAGDKRERRARRRAPLPAREVHLTGPRGEAVRAVVHGRRARDARRGGVGQGGEDSGGERGWIDGDVSRREGRNRARPCWSDLGTWRGGLASGRTSRREVRVVRHAAEGDAAQDDGDPPAAGSVAGGAGDSDWGSRRRAAARLGRHAG